MWLLFVRVDVVLVRCWWLALLVGCRWLVL